MQVAVIGAHLARFLIWKVRESIRLTTMNTTIDDNKTRPKIHETGEAEGFLPTRDNKGAPIAVIGTRAIRDGFDTLCLEQALNARSAPGVTNLVINPDAHAGYGAPVGCVMTSPSHIYPGPVGVDIKCSMSLMQLNVPTGCDQRSRHAPGIDRCHC